MGDSPASVALWGLAPMVAGWLRIVRGEIGGRRPAERGIRHRDAMSPDAGTKSHRAKTASPSSSVIHCTQMRNP